MILSALAMSLLLAGSTPEVLDANGMKAAIQTARESTDLTGQALNGRRFKIVMPVRQGDRQNLRTYKSPARWRYDRGNRELEITIGLGEISPQNYDKFDAQGLAKLPALQTTYFAVEERKVQTAFVSRAVTHRELVSEAGIRSLGVSYGLATPYPADGEAGLPSGFKPLMISRMKMDPANVNKAVEGMTMVVEGQVTSLADDGPLICGGFRGMLLAANITGDKLKFLTDKQCFVTARIDRVSLYGGKATAGSALLKRWGQ
jgi:hypothetical protein